MTLHEPATHATPAGAPGRGAQSCRSCGAPLSREVVDLGMSPLCESFVPPERRDAMEPFYPLRAMVCEACFLVQLGEFVAPEAIFDEYAYFSSYATSWVAHARRYVEAMIARLDLGRDSFVVELASNDGYLLQHFLPHAIPVLGVEPAANVAEAARAKGVPTRVAFFGEALARELRAAGPAADLIVANNVLAQVPDLNDFVAGIRVLLAPEGVATLEFPHLERLVAEAQFDTIYHEHFSYFSLIAVETLAARHGLRVIDAEEWPTHGGSLRVFLAHADSARPTGPRVPALLARERAAGLDRVETYAGFQDRVQALKRRLLSFLIVARDEGRTVVGYGAPGKGNTLLNYCGIGPDLLAFTVDRNPYKHGRFTPGRRIPILPVEAIDAARPDYVLILPWNLTAEIVRQMAHIGAWGGRFVTPIPYVTVVDPATLAPAETQS